MNRKSIRPLVLLGLALLMSISTLQIPAEEQPASDTILLPRPRQLERQPGTFRIEPDRFILIEGIEGEDRLHTGRAIQEALAAIGPRWELTAARGADFAQLGAIVTIDPKAVDHAQGYELTVSPKILTIVAHDPAGAFYAAMTLRQIARQSKDATLPCLRIRDWPDFAHRGVMLDISRDRVPTMETLYALVDLLAEWKFNEFQIYMQHTFAYRNHREVWQAASPLTGEEILALDAYCRARHIDLVPNQASFAHLHRWLTLPRYRPLAEIPERPFQLAPVVPGSIALLDEMYAELLPHFSSKMVNVNCDETFDLGKGQSKDAVAKLGVGRVYLDFLLKIHAIASKHNRRMQFWGDIIMQHPELIPELPKDAIALEWGYEASHPFAEHGKKFAQAGIEFYVCPGTSSWNAIVGRTENAVGNLRNAAENGLANGAVGFLITDWGDNGHWQHLPISYPGYAYGAAVSWAVEANRDLDLPRALNLHAFQDPAEIMGPFAYDLGNAYKETGAIFGNSNVFFHMLTGPNQPLSEGEFSKLTTATLTRAIEHIDGLLARLPQARMSQPDADLTIALYRNNAAMARHACRLALARLNSKTERSGKIADIAAAQREQLAAELEQILADYRRLWLAQSRPGGLPDSVRAFEQFLEFYRIPPK